MKFLCLTGNFKCSVLTFVTTRKMYATFATFSSGNTGHSVAAQTQYISLSKQMKPGSNKSLLEVAFALFATVLYCNNEGKRLNCFS